MSIRDYHALATRLATSGEIGFGEAYMAGDWDSPDLVDLLEAILRRIWTVVPRPVAMLRRLTQIANPRHQDNDLNGARRNVAHHYDLSNELFAQFLDETMTYSAALFEHQSDSLAVAQGRKIDRLLDATGVGPGVRLLEIGTGLGRAGHPGRPPGRPGHHRHPVPPAGRSHPQPGGGGRTRTSGRRSGCRTTGR